MAVDSFPSGKGARPAGSRGKPSVEEEEEEEEEEVVVVEAEDANRVDADGSDRFPPRALPEEDTRPKSSEEDSWGRLGRRGKVPVTPATEPAEAAVTTPPPESTGGFRSVGGNAGRPGNDSPDAIVPPVNTEGACTPEVTAEEGVDERVDVSGSVLKGIDDEVFGGCGVSVSLIAFIAAISLSKSPKPVVEAKAGALPFGCGRNPVLGPLAVGVLTSFGGREPDGLAAAFVQSTPPVALHAAFCEVLPGKVDILEIEISCK